MLYSGFSTLAIRSNTADFLEHPLLDFCGNFLEFKYPAGEWAYLFFIELISGRLLSRMADPVVLPTQCMGFPVYITPSPPTLGIPQLSNFCQSFRYKVVFISISLTF